MIRGERRFAADVGGCRACDKYLHPMEFDEVTCIRIGTLTSSHELRFCDDCLPELLAEAVLASKRAAKATENGGMVGVEFAPRGDAVRSLPPRTSTSAVRRLKPKSVVSTRVPKAYRAKRPKRPSAAPVPASTVPVVPTRGRRPCPDCGDHFLVTKAGVMRAHDVLASVDGQRPRRRCPGSGKEPREATRTA